MKFPKFVGFFLFFFLSNEIFFRSEITYFLVLSNHQLNNNVFFIKSRVLHDWKLSMRTKSKTDKNFSNTLLASQPLCTNALLQFGDFSEMTTGFSFHKTMLKRKYDNDTWYNEWIAWIYFWSTIKFQLFIFGFHIKSLLESS